MPIQQRSLNDSYSHPLQSLKTMAKFSIVHF